MLTQGPAPDPKCKLNIPSFLTLPHPLYHLICTKDIMVFVLLLQMMGGWEGWGGGWFIYVRVWVKGQGVGIIFFPSFVLLCAVVKCSFMTGA